MKKLTATSVILLATLAMTFHASAAEKGTRNTKDNAKETKELLKFSVSEFTGTEDSEVATLELMPADSHQPSQKNNPDSIAKPSDKTQNTIQKNNSAN